MYLASADSVTPTVSVDDGASSTEPQAGPSFLQQKAREHLMRSSSISSYLELSRETACNIDLTNSLTLATSAFLDYGSNYSYRSYGYSEAYLLHEPRYIPGLYPLELFDWMSSFNFTDQQI